MTRHALVVFFLVGGAMAYAQSIRDTGSRCALAGPISGSSATGLTAEAGFACQVYSSGRTPWVADHALHVGARSSTGAISSPRSSPTVWSSRSSMRASASGGKGDMR